MNERSKKQGAKEDRGRVNRKSEAQEERVPHPAELIEAAKNPRQASPDAILGLQKTHGNRFVQRAIQGDTVQRSKKTPVGTMILIEDKSTDEYWGQEIQVHDPSMKQTAVRTD